MLSSLHTFQGDALSVVISVAVVFATLWMAHYFLVVARPPRVIFQENSFNRDILSRCSTLQEVYWPTFWCFNRHLQIIFFIFHERFYRHVEFRSEVLTMPDGGHVSLEWAVEPSPLPPDAPTLVLLHTLTGTAYSLRGHVDRMQHHLAGWRVVVFHRRGHLPSSLQSPRFNTMGCTRDFGAALQHIATTLPSSPLYALGMSAGSALLVRYLGEAGAHSLVRGSVAYSPGYDITRSFARCHWFYDRKIVSKMNEFFIGSNKHLFEHHADFNRLVNARNVVEFHDSLFFCSGFESKDEYYARSNPWAVSNHITTPMLWLNSADDPICSRANVDENLDYFAKHPSAVLALTARGSHCSFWEGLFAHRSWGERVAAEYLLSVHHHYQTHSTHAS